MIRQRDINSAYPWACTILPCLIHGRWIHTRTPTPGSFYIGKYRFSHPADSAICHLPIRAKDGSISYPLKGVGWYWSPEVESAEEAGTDARLLGRAWQYVRECDCEPFQFVTGYYTERKKLGKSGRGLVLKLALNSLYGKLAQSVGAAPYANPVWAGLITSLVRARLIDDYMRHPEWLVMLATDGAFYWTPDDDPGDWVGDRLGQWDEKFHDDGIFIIQPGLYFTSTELGKPKTRGVPQKAVAALREEFEKAWNTFATVGGVMPSVSVPLRSFVGLRLAHARGKPEMAGQWVETAKAVSFDWKTKGHPSGLYVDGVGHRVIPKPGAVDLVTTPYPKLIGRNLVTNMDRLLDDEDPEG